MINQFSLLLFDSDFHCPTLKLNNNVKAEKIKKVLRPFFINWAQVDGVRKIVKEEIEFGLASDPPIRSSLLMPNTLVPADILNADFEDGLCLAIDFGGTSVRVLACHFAPNKKCDVKIKYYEIPEDLFDTTSTVLFDFLASCILDFVSDNNLHNQKLFLGFTFSFPMKNHSINSADLVSWTKGFRCSDAIGKDVVKLLQEAINKQKAQIEVVAVLNDCTGILARGAYLYQNCAIALGIGSGCNICYLEKVERMPKLKTEKLENQYADSKELAVDTELGGLGDNGLINFVKTGFDVQLDKDSKNAGEFTFDKFIGGKYVGELVRRVLLYLIQKDLLLNEKFAKNFEKPNSISANECSMIEQDSGYNQIKVLLQNMGCSEIAEEDLSIMKHVVSVVFVRGAVLVAACLSVFIERIGRNNVTIAAAGSVIEKHPKLIKLVEDFIREILKERSTSNFDFSLRPVDDGAGIGAAILARGIESRR